MRSHSAALQSAGQGRTCAPAAPESGHTLSGAGEVTLTEGRGRNIGGADEVPLSSPPIRGGGSHLRARSPREWSHTVGSR
jgi:hypothetical protein